MLGTLLNGYVSISPPAVNDNLNYSFMSSAWNARRFVVTEETISFSLPNEDLEIDFIPLHEVSKVEEMFTNDGGSMRRLPHSVDLLEECEAVLLDNAFQVATIPAGYNSGRTYYLKVESAQESRQLVRQLQELAERAAQRVAGKTRIRLMQESMRRIYNSNPFQTVAASLIIAVRANTYGTCGAYVRYVRAARTCGTHVRTVAPHRGLAAALAPDPVLAARAHVRTATAGIPGPG